MTASDADPRTGGGAVADALRAAGVEVVFGLPGVHNLAIWKALAGGRPRLVTVRHEQAAAGAADGYARATGRPGVALVTTGPGAANTLGAVGEAWASRSPVVVIVTDVPTTLRKAGVYRGSLHETTDQLQMFGPVTKAALRVTSASDTAATVARAVGLACSAPRRPVVVEIPTDLLSAPAGPGDGWLAESAAAGEPVEPDLEDVAAAAEVVDAAHRPLIWAGGGAVAAGAGAEVGDLAERLAAPVLTTYQARGLLGRGHPCAVGLPPHVEAVGRLWDDADVVIAVGSDLDGMMTQNWRMPAPPALVVVNVDAADATKNYAARAVITADARAGVGALAAEVAARGGLDDLGRRLQRLRAGVRESLSAECPEAVAFLDVTAAALPDDAVVVADMCIPGYWLAGFLPVAAPRRLAYPMGWGTLGFALPAAVGAASAGAGPVVSVSGDGGFLFACGELATVAQEGLDLTAVVVDDGGYGMLRYDQRRRGDMPFGVDLHGPDFAALARAFGLEADTVEGLGQEFGDALKRHVATPGPSVLVARAALGPPPTTSPRWYRAG